MVRKFRYMLPKLQLVRLSAAFLRNFCRKGAVAVEKDQLSPTRAWIPNPLAPLWREVSPGRGFESGGLALY